MSIIMALLLFIGVLFSRPMILGYNLAYIGVICFTLCFLLFLPQIGLAPRERTALFARRCTLDFAFLLLYCGVLALSDPGNALKQTAIGATALSSCFAVSTMAPQRSRTVFAVLLSFLIISGFFTLSLIDWADSANSRISLEWLHVQVKDRSDLRFGVGIYFPFSTMHNVFTTNYGQFIRASYLCIEPGVGVLVVTLWRLLLAPNTGLRSLMFDLIFLAGLVATFSTSAPLVAGIYFIGRMLTSEHVNSTLFMVCGISVLLVLSVLTFLYAPAFGYYDKIITHADSFYQRTQLYSEEGALTRIAKLVVVAAHLLLISWLEKGKVKILAPILFIICALNVLAFYPLYFVGMYLLTRVQRCEWIDLDYVRLRDSTRASSGFDTTIDDRPRKDTLRLCAPQKWRN